MSFAFKDFADVINGKVLFTLCDDVAAQLIFFRRFMWPFSRWQEEFSMRIFSKFMNEHPKAALGISESFSRLFAWKFIDKISSQGLILSVSGIGGLQKEPGDICYFFI